MEVAKEEALALGIGEPENLTNEQLLRFFEIVYPLEPQSVRSTRPKLISRAAFYLRKASVQDFLKNAQFLSKNAKVNPKFERLVQAHTEKLRRLNADAQFQMQQFATDLKRLVPSPMPACFAEIEQLIAKSNK
jgi:hypothetical protein